MLQALKHQLLKRTEAHNDVLQASKQVPDLYFLFLKGDGLIDLYTWGPRFEICILGAQGFGELFADQVPPRGGSADGPQPAPDLSAAHLAHLALGTVPYEPWSSFFGNLQICI